MSTREIAELTEKRHDHVLRDVRSLIDQGAITAPNFGDSEYKDASGKSNRKTPCILQGKVVYFQHYQHNHWSKAMACGGCRKSRAATSAVKQRRRTAPVASAANSNGYSSRYNEYLRALRNTKK